MKKFLILAVILLLNLEGCYFSNNNDGNDEKTEISTSLKISNHSAYELFNVRYSSVDFGDLGIGNNKTMNVNANSPEPIYFEFNINNNQIQCKTNDLIICDEGTEEDLVITNNTVITAIESGKTGSLSSVFNALSKPIFQLSQDSTVIDNNSPLPFDFGLVKLGANKPLVFIIKNIGNLPLELTGDPVIVSSNIVFTIPSQPTNKTINPGSSIAFLIQYTPISEIEDTATISIFNNSDEMVFTLNVKGTGYADSPQITVKQGSATINQYGEHDYGSILSDKSRDITFTIENIGGEDLSIISVNGNRINLEENAEGFFSITQQPLNAMIAPGGSTSFTIRFSPTTIGNNYTAGVYIKTNSRNYEDFAFRVKGNGRNLTIGDEGPGGGMIFFASGGQYKECSPDLGNYNWDDAITEASNYKGGDFTNWYLPDIGELNLMYQNLHRNGGLGGFLGVTYWSSLEGSTSSAWGLYFGNGTQTTYTKSSMARVRAVRAF